MSLNPDEHELRVLTPCSDISDSNPSSSSTTTRTTPSPDESLAFISDIDVKKDLIVVAIRPPIQRQRLTFYTCFAVFLLCFINAINYVNRYTLPPVVGRLKVAFALNDMQLGLIQTCFELVYVVSSPLFGYLGDRFNRRILLTISLVVANASGLASSMVPVDKFPVLLFTRALLGMGEAAFSNIGPVIIADMFVGKARTVAIALFQFAIPIGCGLGYIIASVVVDYTDDWRWAFRLTGVPVALGVVLLLIFVREPRRGEAENATSMRKTSFLKDISYILKSPSFTLTTLAFIGVAFATGALCYWCPYLINRMYAVNAMNHDNVEAEIGFIFGVITILSGMAGVVGGAVASNKWLKPKCGPSADGIVCGIGMLVAAPCIYASLIAIQVRMMLVTWISIFFGIAALCCCWVLLSEITMNVIIPTRRSTAAAFMSAVSHAFGDALSPYITGMISDTFRSAITINDQPGSVNLFADFMSMQSSLFLSPFVITIAGGVFLMGSLFLNEDADKAKRLAHCRELATIAIVTGSNSKAVRRQDDDCRSSIRQSA